jgi:ribosomal protein L32E
MRGQVNQRENLMQERKGTIAGSVSLRKQDRIGPNAQEKALPLANSMDSSSYSEIVVIIDGP